MVTPGKASTRPTKQLTSEKFVESCGAILFDLTNPQDRKVCIVRFRDTGEWLLAKGRRNYGESRQDAALREVMEETGHRCHLFPVTMATRATPPDAPAIFRDEPHVYENLTEPFACQIRDMKGRTKIIWWYIAALDDPDESVEKLPGEQMFEPVFISLSEAVDTPTFQGDRELVAKAIELVTATLDGDQTSAVEVVPIRDTEENAPSQQGKKGKKKKARTPEQRVAKMEKNKKHKAEKLAQRAKENATKGKVNAG